MVEEYKSATGETIRVQYAIYTKVISVREDREREWVHFDGSRESMAFAKDTFKPGQKVRISFEKVD